MSGHYLIEVHRENGARLKVDEIFGTRREARQLRDRYRRSNSESTFHERWIGPAGHTTLKPKGD